MIRARKIVLSFVCLLAAVAVVACSSDSPTNPTPSAPYSQTDLVVGTGTEAVTGKSVNVAYTGWLYDPARTDGKGTQFDTSSSYTFSVGAGRVIAGWDQGVPGMRVGGLRRLVLPPSLAYGSAGAAPKIPGNATLVFDITLLGVQ